MTTQFYGACSLDGFIATPDHDLSWLLQFGEIEGSSYPAFIRDVGALAMGSHTCEWTLKHAIGAGLLDELIVQVAPVTLGAGAPLLPRRITQPGALRLQSVATLGGLFAELRYAVQLP
ncbi:dihydrofolate reductase family protein [Acidovorax sp. LjRoot117]|uniref:dihydrofolate reductase family protein n=1 Tax=Acidovorax sp. LjRoot117 TaxID=3342255 RepID=UPI003ECE9339